MPSSGWAVRTGPTTAAPSRRGRGGRGGLGAAERDARDGAFQPRQDRRPDGGYISSNVLSSFFALKATATSASLVGMGSVLTVTLNNLLLEVNQVSNSLNGAGELYGPINFAASFRRPGATGRLAVATGTGTPTVTWITPTRSSWRASARPRSRSRNSSR